MELFYFDILNKDLLVKKNAKSYRSFNDIQSL
jgi:hypothetical protein